MGKNKLQRIVDGIDDKMSEDISWLPDEVVSFNPSMSEDVDGLLKRYGTEGLFEIAYVLEHAAASDMDGAIVKYFASNVEQNN